MVESRFVSPFIVQTKMRPRTQLVRGLISVVQVSVGGLLEDFGYRAALMFVRCVQIPEIDPGKM